MKRRVGLTTTGLVGAMLVGGGWLFAILAQPAAAADLPLKAPVAPVPYWWFSGNVELGGRDFLNDPMRGGLTARGQQSLAKYYEYSTVAPGVFGNVFLSTGTSDGLYKIDLGGHNIGYSDQDYFLDFSKAGQHYFDFVWDQTPHVYSMSALTPWQGVGSNALTLAPGCASRTQTAPNLIATCLNGPFDVGISRDTAAAQYRWTPTDAWDVKVDYSNMHRSGTQVDGVVGMSPTASQYPAGPNQVIKPVDDTTQNFGVNGEYGGTSPWNQKYTVKVGYVGSVYSDGLSSYTVQNPYCTGNTCTANGAAGPTAFESPFNRLTTPPDNAMNGVNGTLAADLPLHSRYVGTVSYNMMTQNAAFLPLSNNPIPVANFGPFVNGIGQTSLNGEINTLLSNNVVTTQITPDLTSKASYRYYEYNNNTPEMLMEAGWPSYDTSATPEGEDALRSLTVAYIKQNAGEDLTWRPTKDWHFGAGYGYERYDYTRADAASTDEHTAKLFADWKPASWFTLRTSGSYSDRTANDYNYMMNVQRFQYPDAGGYAAAYRQFFLDDRTRTKANIAFDLVLVRGLTITPTFKYQDDEYGLSPVSAPFSGTTNVGHFGLNSSTSQGAGVDIGYVVNPDLAFSFSYMREYYNQFLYQGYTAFGATTVTPANLQDRTTVDTFTAAVRYTAIPNKLDFDLRYTASQGVDDQNFSLPTVPAGPTGGQFPNVNTWLQRLEASAIYTFDQDLVNRVGLKGKVRAKLRYVWERNSVDNWAQDPLLPYTPGLGTGTSANAIWLASDNPNYNVHLLAGSLSYAW